MSKKPEEYPKEAYEVDSQKSRKNLEPTQIESSNNDNEEDGPLFSMPELEPADHYGVQYLVVEIMGVRDTNNS